MRITAVSFVRLLSLLGPAAALHGMEPTLPEKIEFNRHVRPILSERDPSVSVVANKGGNYET